MCKEMACRSSESTLKSEEDKQLLSNLGIDPKIVREYKYRGYLPNNIFSLIIIFKPLSNDVIYNFFKVTCSVNSGKNTWSCSEQLLMGFDIQDSYVYTNIDIAREDLKKLKEAFTNSIRIKEQPKEGMVVTESWRNFSISGDSNKLILHEQSCHGNWISYKKKLVGKNYFYLLEKTNKYIRM